MAKKIRLGDKLIDEGLITEEQLEGALTRQKITGNKLGEQIIEDNLLTESQIFKFLEDQLDIKHINLNSYVINPDAIKKIDKDFAEENDVIPIDIKGGELVVVMADPMDLMLIDDMNMMTGMPIAPMIASKQSIEDAIDIAYAMDEDFSDDLLDDEENGEQQTYQSQESDEITNSPMVRLVNKIISSGIKAEASDIHIEPTETNVRVRFRIDGDLQEFIKSKKETLSPLVTRIKIMGKMDISERRRPQDGRVETIIDSHLVDLRISILPTVHGEKVVIRLLDRSSVVTDKSELGFSEKNLKILDNLTKSPQGIILATGPTGSGKTTTLYSILKEMNSTEKNVITVEDPVEYRLKGINQVQVNKKAGLSFASGLRAILRQDPDVVMVGEIRDEETAQIAMRASITGHVVLSTLHTNDTSSTITRLTDMGIKPYILSSSIVGIISQRLVKKLCNSCKESKVTTKSEMKELGLDSSKEIYKAKGCNACGQTGYSGRTAIHEIMLINKSLKRKISNGESAGKIKQQALKDGMETLKESCSELVIKGKTSIEELIKVTYTID
ncbi:MAG: GspE/PulE family protein [Bacillota bacterium]